MSQAGINRIWAQALLETLAENGVKHICIAPGSRSTPLSLEALELAEQHGFTLHTHFDERGLAFLALGLAKASREKAAADKQQVVERVAIIVTSGTAVANLLPAVAETGLTGESLVLLTADRPENLIGVGANQAIQQQGIFSSHVVTSVHLPSPSIDTPLADSLLEIQSALALQASQTGSLHINCPYPEPLYLQSEQQKLQYLPYLQQARCQAKSQVQAQCHNKHTIQSALSAEVSNQRQQALLNQLGDKKGVVIVGKMPLKQAQLVRQFAEQLGWPVLCDPQSGISSGWAHYDLWLQNDGYQKQLSAADCILQFGARLVSKRLGFWIKSMANHETCPYWLFDPAASILNPDHLPQLRTVSSIEASLGLLQVAINDQTQNTQHWGDDLQQASSVVGKAAQNVINQSTAVNQPAALNQAMVLKPQAALTECQLAEQLPALLAALGSGDLFIGNSLIVRLVDMLSAIPDTSVYTNRGASGIDGLIATTAGVQREKQQAMLTLIGDTSLLYDLNSLSLLTCVPKPHVVLVSNNDGGAIFDLLPVPDAQKQTLYQMPHGYQFEFAAKQFGLDYLQPALLTQCLQGITDYVQRFEQGETNTALVVEVITPPEQASTQIQTILQAVKVHVV
ncbi:2-succinyl-5-enolpyruvyl-6-hydroxy-3-cyclohexene-1-carboxylic-acid synthase [Vibrio sp. S11_S32]|uniref:2-succinyl-5-enolpyruvyl-6-hydroxy-3- cyclohexene-1-carboxylic-acid synthase n=1 Tax=Vibrio sp. S11_S32 TaxID=2720225 RepID=UPI0016803451|nr:2-succinyl-5-enolpyruvyl-6-hydroxy-3-cyclohexene-1-carboxylic-acid synthase [Vibrio sp. S11_S32]MBD1575510.1 2-succinyl-5-enolpyruvyl-6-hydroxy-3-cyclohexene-1-carboxylic-acid synthase [Vibrio sp. S11_S32]